MNSALSNATENGHYAELGITAISTNDDFKRFNPLDSAPSDFRSDTVSEIVSQGRQKLPAIPTN